jgi:RNA polymerase sigma-70 factor (ECF subfamily)
MRDSTLSNKELALLLKECSKNNTAALEELYIKVVPILNRYAMKILRCESLTNEVLQDSMLQIWEKADVFDAARGNPMSWMYAIVRNRAIDKIRTENKHLRNCSEEERLYAEHVASGDFQPETELSRDQLMVFLNHQFESLPKDQRLSIYLTYFYDLSRTELAEVLDTNINTIKSWLHRGIKSLKQHEQMVKTIS